MKYFHRKLQEKIHPWLDKPDTIVILGARQVGKNSLLALLDADLKELWRNSKSIITLNFGKA